MNTEIVDGQTQKYPTAPNTGFLYPQLKNADERKNFIYFMVNSNLEKLKTYHDMTLKKVKKLRTSYKTLNGVTSGLAAASVGLTTGAVVTALTGVGIAVSIPLGGLAGGVSMINLIGGIAASKIEKNLIYFEKLLFLTEIYKIRIESMVALSLTDACIDSGEYVKIINLVEEFEEKRRDIESIKAKPAKSFFRGGPRASDRKRK
jgi:hypothetical protein